MISVDVTIIYGTMIKANTHHCVQLLLKSLKLNIDLDVTEFFLSKNLSSSCDECSFTLVNGEEGTSHVNYADSIINSLDKANLIIFACPVFGCDISREMKLFLNHLSCHYMHNETNSSMRNKIGLIMSTAAGAGLFYTTTILKRNLHFLGIQNILNFSQTLYEVDWKYLNLKTKKRINKKILKLSNKVSDLYNSLRPAKVSILSEMRCPQNKTIFEQNNYNITNLTDAQKQSTFLVRNI